MRITVAPTWNAAHRFDVENRLGKSEPWTVVFQYRQDEPQIAEAERIIFLSDDRSYFWLGTTFGNTADQGRTWALFDFSRQSAFGRQNTLNNISEIRLNHAGHGTVRFVENKWVSPQPTFTTTDFGNTWEEQQSSVEPY